MDSCLLAEVRRGGRVESIHSGAYVVSDAQGKVVFGGGDGDRAVFPRSAIKIMQALPLILDGVADGVGLSSAELALACASHTGLPLHADTALGMLRKAGLGPGALECGTHWPTEPEAARALATSGMQPCALHNNCSGKHAGFLCSAVFKNVDPSGYVGPDHPIMRRVLECVGVVLDVDPYAEEFGIDGCSIPTFAVPLRSLAAGFARLASGSRLPVDYASAANRLGQAVAANPAMIAGPGKFDTIVTEQFGETVFLKSGAEGVCCGAIPAAGLGFAVKCDDGASRGSEMAAAALLARLLGDSPFLESLQSRPLYNWNGLYVGSVEAAIG